jgi:hypothetical protein
MVEIAHPTLFVLKNVDPKKCFVVLLLIPIIARMLTGVLLEEEIMIKNFVQFSVLPYVWTTRQNARGRLKPTAVKISIRASIKFLERTVLNVERLAL